MIGIGGADNDQLNAYDTTLRVLIGGYGPLATSPLSSTETDDGMRVI
jgi:hypothetical protein